MEHGEPKQDRLRLVTGPEVEELVAQEEVSHPYPRISLAHLTEMTYVPGNKWHHPRPEHPDLPPAA